MAIQIKCEQPKEIWDEIRELISIHYKVGCKEPFLKCYPALYRLYLQISAYRSEFGLKEA